MYVDMIVEYKNNIENTKWKLIPAIEVDIQFIYKKIQQAEWSIATAQ